MTQAQPSNSKPFVVINNGIFYRSCDTEEEANQAATDRTRANGLPSAVFELRGYVTLDPAPVRYTRWERKLSRE